MPGSVSSKISSRFRTISSVVKFVSKITTPWGIILSVSLISDEEVELYVSYVPYYGTHERSVHFCRMSS